MTENEENAALGRLLLDYRETKKRLTLLIAEAERIGKYMRELERIVSADPDRVVFSGQAVTGEYLKIPSFSLEALSNIGKLPELVQEIRTTKTEVERLARRLSALGIEDSPFS